MALTKSQKHMLAVALHNRLSLENNRVLAERSESTAGYDRLIHELTAAIREAKQNLTNHYLVPNRELSARHEAEREALRRQQEAEREALRRQQERERQKFNKSIDDPLTEQYAALTALTEARKEDYDTYDSRLVDIPKTMHAFWMHVEFLGTPGDPETILNDFLAGYKP